MYSFKIGNNKHCGFYFFRRPKDISTMVDFSSLSRSQASSAMFILSYIRFWNNLSKRSTLDVYISKKTISRFCTVHNPSSIFTFLQDSGLIIRDDSFLPGSFSKKYRLTDKLLNAQWVKDDYLSFVKTLPRTCKNTQSHCDVWGRFIDTLVHWQDLDDSDPLKKLGQFVSEEMENISAVTEDLEAECAALAVETQVENEKECAIKNRAIDIRNFFRAKRGRKLIPHQTVGTTTESITKTYVDSILSLNDPDEKYVKFHLTSSYGDGTFRMFHNITNLKSELRGRIRYKGEKMINIDIQSAQVCLLSLFYNDSAEHQAEKARFIEFVTEKDFYTELAARSSVPMERKKAKQVAFCIMFAQNYLCGKQELYPVFCELFPLLAATITTIKSKDYKRVAYDMQSGEAKIVILKALSILKDEKIPAFPIHDSLMTLPQYEERVSEVLLQSFEEVAGFRPKLKVDRGATKA